MRFLRFRGVFLFQHAQSSLSYCTLESQTQSLENLNQAFEGASLFEGIGLDTWQTSRLVSMSRTFSGAVNFNGDLGNWDTSKVTSMGASFRNAEKFTGRGSISEWSVPKVTTFKAPVWRTFCFFNFRTYISSSTHSTYNRHCRLRRYVSRR